MKPTILPIFVVAALALFSHGAWADEEKAATEVAVQVAQIKRATVHAYVTTYGTVEAEPAGKGKPAASARLASPFAGIITEANAYEGQPVKKGDLLFRLDSRAVEVAVKSAELLNERQKKLIEVGGTSQRALQESEQKLAAARAQYALLKIEAPLSGIVVRVNAKPGESVDVNSVLAEIVDLDRLVVTARVPSGEAEKITTDTKALLSTSGAEKLVESAVSYVAPQVDSTSGTVLVRVAVPKGAKLRSGQFIRVQMVVEERADRLVVPRESVYKDYDGQTTLSVVEGDKAIQKNVKAGLRDGNWVEVEGEGLAEGMTVVTLGSYALPKETKIRILSEGKGEVK